MTNRPIPTLLALLASAFVGVSAPADETPLAENFDSPPATAKPYTWWHWMNGNVTKEGITADLESMARVGIGGAHLFNVSEWGPPPGPVRFYSPEWIEMWRHTVAEATRLGLKIGIHNCAGWSTSGGTWVKPEHAMQTVVTASETVRGPVAFDAVLPQPPVTADSYQDIAVLAFPTPAHAGATMRDHAPAITTSVPEDADGSHLLDDHPATSVALPRPSPDAPHFVQITFAEPYTARRLRVTPGLRITGADARLEISADGQNFTSVRALTFPNSAEPQSFSFPPVTSRHFRIVFERSHGEMRRLVLAEVDLTPEPGIDNLSAKAFINRGDISPEESLPEVSSAEIISREAIIDLSGRLAADGRLRWDAPDGDWTILRIGHTPTGKINHPAPVEAKGLEVDKLSREAVDAHWAGAIHPLLEALGPLAGSTFDTVLIDSHEAGTQNWTPALRGEFQRRCGYDLQPFLPALAGHIVDSPDSTERFLWDFRRVIANLFAENHSGRFAELARQNGLLFALEPYGDSVADNLQYGSHADIPMGEFWDGGGFEGASRRGSSVAHVHGQRIVGAEAFTAMPERAKWLQHPFSLKAQGDYAWASGINRFYLHTYAHQPWTAPNRYPGMTMSRFGSLFGRTTTWWELSGPWMKYIARSQYLLQQGRFIADVCFFSGDGAPNNLRSDPLPAGYDYDGLSADALHLMSVRDGRIVLPGGMSYRLLVLPPEPTMTLPTLRKLKELADAGASIIGPPPLRTPSLIGYPESEAELEALVRELWPQRIRNISPAEALTAMNLPPDFEVKDNPASPITFIHRSLDDAEMYFVASRDPGFIRVECLFRVSGRTPELWHPDSGRIERAPVWREENGRTLVPLDFDPSGSVFVVFRKSGPGDHVTEAEFHPAAQPGSTARLRVLSATYGAVDDSRSRDVTGIINSLIVEDTLSLTVKNPLLAGDPAPNQPKQLHIDYELDGKRAQTTVPEHRTLQIGSPKLGPPPLQLAVDAAGAPNLRAFTPGTVSFKTASGRSFRAEVAAVPAPVRLAGPWSLRFPPGWGAPAEITLPELICWTESPEPGVKYFSGTASYQMAFDWKPEYGGRKPEIILDLGKVHEIAEVRINGQDLGILWKPPFRVEITDAIKPGANELEIRVTNLWPNRMIGDENLPPDREWVDRGPGAEIKEWPQWLLDGQPSPAGRFTFATWHHWKKGDPLLPSGLIGPVVLRSQVTVPAIRE